MGTNCCSSEKSNCKARCFKIALMAVAGIAALGWVVMLLWNCLMPELFLGARPVSYLQALGVLLLSKILFSGFHGGCHGRCKAHRHGGENMTPEEREQLKGQFKRRWGNWCESNKGGEEQPKETPARSE